MNRPHPLHLLLVVGTLVLALAPSASAAGLKAPTLASPDDDQQVSSVPAFTWNKVGKADRYEFQLSADQNFGSIVLGRGVGSFNTKNLAATITKSLPDGTYWWRVRAISASNKAGAWSAKRSIRKVWAPAPQLLEPANDSQIVFPGTPLILKWAAVPRAFKYRVYIATDPSLGTLVVGRSPIETSATVFSPGAALAPGKYYWAVEPVDAAGHRGQRSAVGSFVWSWPSSTKTGYQDLVADSRLTEPHVSWDPIPGAVAYQVEINFSEDFAAGSRVCCDSADTGIADGLILGTSFSPKRTLPNNVYHWRVRGIDTNGNAGGWNVGTPFDQFYGIGASTISNLRLRDNDDASLPAGSTTDSPVISWDPVPGAASYGVEVTPQVSGACNWSSISTSEEWDVETTSTSFTFLAPIRRGDDPWPISNASAVPILTDNGKSLVSGRTYCVRVHAKRGDKAILSDTTQLGGLGAAAFTYQPFVPAPAPPGAITAVAGDYVAPLTGAATGRAPLFTWKRIEGAQSYFVIVSKNATFTNVVDRALTNFPAYAPRMRTYADDNTPYYWAVLPAKIGDGQQATSEPSQNAPQSFDKRSSAPVLVAPGQGTAINDHPVFRWTSGDGAIEVPEGAREYRLQVATDSSFVDLLDDVTTKSTSYTASESYPSDTVLYWRVRVNDANSVGLTWSEVSTFRRVLPTPALLPENSTGGSIIPPLRWAPVQGAISYDVHVDQSDGTKKDFELSGTAFTPTTWYGTGVWRWQVRANYPGGTSREVSSAYTSPFAFTRRIPSPDGVNAETRNGRILMKWEPSLSAGIKEYRVDFSDSDSFATVGQSVRTQNLAVAPDITKAPFANGGAVYWRVFAVDEGSNLGGAAAGRFVTARRMIVKASGTLYRKRRSRLVVQTVNAAGRAVRKAKVRLTGRPLRPVAKRTRKRGTAVFRVRPRRKGSVVIRATRDGYRPAVLRLTVN